MTAGRARRAGRPPPAPGPVKRWVLGRRPRTLPAAVVPVVVGTAAAHPLQRARPDHRLVRPRRHWSQARGPSVWWWAHRRAGRGPGHPGRHQLRQRLLGRHPGHRRRPGRPGAPGGLGPGLPGGGQAGRARLLRRGRRGRPGPGLGHLVVDPGGRRGLPAGRLVLHRRPPALRLRRAGRGLRVRVLRPGGHGRDVLRADAAARRGRGLVRRRRWWACWPPPCCWPTTCGTSPPTPATGKRTLAVRVGRRDAGWLLRGLRGAALRRRGGLGALVG